MNRTDDSQETEDNTLERHQSRAGLVWAVIVFQAKLIVDGLRDVVLVPVSLFAALFGLIAGGNEPDKYFYQILKLGRRSEIWINLFGHRSHQGTADAFIEPLKERVLNESKQRPWVTKAEQGLNQTLDKVNERIDTAVKHRDHKE